METTLYNEANAYDCLNFIDDTPEIAIIIFSTLIISAN